VDLIKQQTPIKLLDSLLLSLDLFLEGFVIEWLDWNGTNKNDWFFAF